MLRLNLKKEPYWLELPAKVRLLVRPLSTAIMSSAQSLVIKQITSQEVANPGLSESLLIKALGHSAIIEWQGVMNAEGTEPAPVNEQNINDLMDIWFIAQEFWKQYTSSLFLLEEEGNGLEPAVNGTSAVGSAIVKSVPNN